MNTIYRILSGIALPCFVVLLLGGCRKDLCDNHYRAAKVDTDWEQVWERDYGRDWENNWSDGRWGYSYGEFIPGTPEGISVLIYDDDSESTKTFLPSSGGEVILNAENSSLLFYNNDTQYIIFDDMAKAPLARATTSTRTRASLSALHTNERTVNPPDVLYVAFTPGLTGIDLHESYRLGVKMQPLVYTYLVRFKIEKGLEYASLARGALAGMAEAVMLRDGSTPDETATLLFDCRLTSWGAEAQVRSFGVAGFPDRYFGKAAGSKAKEAQRYTLNLELRLRNGRIKTLLFDVSDQMLDQPRGGVIEVGNIEIDEDDASVDSGFDVNVDDWGEYEDIDLPITH